MRVTVVVPTFNEAPNVPVLVDRIAAAMDGVDADILFVDDSTDDTPAAVLAAAADAPLPVRLIHRGTAQGGLSGAVIRGITEADADVCVVMDADLQHPPEEIPALINRYRRGDVDVVVASRYTAARRSSGFADTSRALVSRASTLATKAMFPFRLKDVTDPMTGFFLVDRRAIDPAELEPRGFKILLEILARRPLRVAEVPFQFATRAAGESKASVRQGLAFLVQLTALRFGKMSLFAIIGGLGAIANLAIMWLLTEADMNYTAAAIIAAEITIVGNFLLQERFVFQDMKGAASSVWVRFGKSAAFNNAELVVRVPVIALLVNAWHIQSVIAAGITLVVAFVVRFLYHSLVVYAPRRAGRKATVASRLADEIDRQSLSPGEL